MSDVSLRCWLSLTVWACAVLAIAVMAMRDARLLGRSRQAAVLAELRLQMGTALLVAVTALLAFDVLRPVAAHPRSAVAALVLSAAAVALAHRGMISGRVTRAGFVDFALSAAAIAAYVVVQPHERYAGPVIAFTYMAAQEALLLLRRRRRRRSEQAPP